MRYTNIGVTADFSANVLVALSILVSAHRSDAMMVLDAEDRVVAVNRAFEQLAGDTQDAIAGTRPALLFAGPLGAAFHQHMWQAIRETGRWRAEFTNVGENGRVFTVELSINTLYDVREKVLARLALFAEILPNESARERTRH